MGVDNEEPSVELERTEYVKVSNQHALLRRVVEAAEIDTVVDTRLVVDSATTTPRKAHENNVIGTMNILAACSGPSSTVRKFVFKSSTHFYGSEQDDPAFFDETMGRPHAPRTPIERDILEAEASVAEYADTNPDVDVTILRFANVLGPDVRTSHIDLFSLPAVPMILGLRPALPVRARGRRGARARARGARAGCRASTTWPADGVLALSEVAGLLGKPYAPILPPWGTGLAAGVAAPAGHADPARDAQPAALRPRGGQPAPEGRRVRVRLHQPRGRDRAGRAHAPASAHARRGVEPYRYEREVEEFLRWSPHVRRREAEPAPDAGLRPQSTEPRASSRRASGARS